MALAAVPEIKTRTIRIAVPEDVAQLVEQYREFLGGATTLDYIYTEAARREIGSDKRFKQSRQQRTA